MRVPTLMLYVYNHPRYPEYGSVDDSLLVLKIFYLYSLELVT